MKQNEYAAVIVTTTADSEETLESIANALLEQRLAACCQISGPVKSIFRWQGNIETAKEFVCSIKTMAAKADAVFATIKSIHSYDEPEIFVTPIVDGSESYLKWIAESVE